MGVEVISMEEQTKRQLDAAGRDRHVVKGRWALSADGKVIPEDQAAQGDTLLYRDGDEISLEDARNAGFVKGEKKAEPKPADKATKKPADKSVRKSATKEG